MNDNEFQRRLEKLRIELEEVEEERKFVLGQSGLHVPGREVRRYEAEVERLKTKIAEIEDALKEKSG